MRIKRTLPVEKKIGQKAGEEVGEKK